MCCANNYGKSHRRVWTKIHQVAPLDAGDLWVYELLFLRNFLCACATPPSRVCVCVCVCVLFSELCICDYYKNTELFSHCQHPLHPPCIYQMVKQPNHSMLWTATIFTPTCSKSGPKESLSMTACPVEDTSAFWTSSSLEIVFPEDTEGSIAVSSTYFNVCTHSVE